MLTLLIVLVVLFVLFSGIGYGYRDRLGDAYGRGASLLGLLVVILLVLLVTEAVKFG